MASTWFPLKKVAFQLETLLQNQINYGHKKEQK